MKNKKTTLTIFLGTYNAEPYLDSLFEQIVTQKDQNFKLLVIDNNSVDNSFQIVDTWRKYFKNRLVSVRNHKNLGVPANIYTNIEKFRTPWFCNFHQDDFYKPNHVSTLNNLISTAGDDIVGVCTTMGSMSNTGEILNSKPRVSWFNPSADQPGQFLQNIKAQTVPYPATAFRLDIFKKAKTSSHNPSFSDTEQTLKFISHGKFIFSKKETMYYRENPASASHLLNSKERIIGAAISLSRVFNSREFDLILEKVPKFKRQAFANHLLKAIESRIPDSDLLHTLQILALEHMIELWGYKETSLVSLLTRTYKNFSSSQTIGLINNLHGNRLEKIYIEPRKQYADKKLKRLWDFYFESNFLIIRKYNKSIVKIIYFFVFMFKPNHIFRNKWK
jgi:glycosyltransferase involved in cell wall biosynthesis